MARAATTTDAFNAVGDPTRRAMLDMLATGEATVGTLANHLNCPQPLVSKHLKVLRDVELVRCRSVGRTRVYRIDRTGFAPLQAWLAELTASINQHYDRLDDYLQALQATGDSTLED